MAPHVDDLAVMHIFRVLRVRGIDLRLLGAGQVKGIVAQNRMVQERDSKQERQTEDKPEVPAHNAR
jgi:hypothetical protein